MKKNVMMRVASALLVAVLLSTCAISGTFAKYVTTGSVSDSARVAKWGVEIVGASAADNAMFTDGYKDTPVAYTSADDAISVKADTAGTAIVAPGTNSTLAAFDITGAPEVDVEVTYVADLKLAGWEVDGDYYCPIVITVNSTKFDGATYASAAEFETAVENAIVGATATYETNEDLSAVEGDLAVTWEWPFSTSADNDVKDTKLGNASAGAGAATIAIDVTITVTQVD